ncbi:MAG: DUF58 domain-containing protein [Pirellulaceae bacterium]|nr:DUF58 domain-containing protein [Pirellulaceae bacterium]
MPLRRRAWLSREGWYYCGVLAFIVGGAVLRSINLLVVLAGMMIAPLVLNWRLVMAGLWGLIVTRRLPEQICAGEPLTVEIDVRNTRPRMASWLVTIEDWIEREPLADDAAALGEASGWNERLQRWLAHVLGEGERVRGEALATVIEPRSTVTATYRVVLHRRGKYRFGPLRVGTRFPLGLVVGRFLLPTMAELIVAPRLGRLTAAWTRLLEADRARDVRRQPQRGYAEGDYYGLRPWQSGDSVRWIHWRATAKTGVPTVLQFERQRSRDVALVLDPWRAARPTKAGLELVELSLSLAATAVADLSSRGHSQLVVAAASRSAQYWAGPASRLFCQEVLAQLATLDSGDGSQLEEALLLARDQSAVGSRIVVVSTRRAPQSLPAEMDVAWIDVGQKDLAELFLLD